MGWGGAEDDGSAVKSPYCSPSTHGSSLPPPSAVLGHCTHVMHTCRKNLHIHKKKRKSHLGPQGMSEWVNCLLRLEPQTYRGVMGYGDNPGVTGQLSLHMQWQRSSCISSKGLYLRLLLTLSYTYIHTYTHAERLKNIPCLHLVLFTREGIVVFSLMLRHRGLRIGQFEILFLILTCWGLR